MDDMIGVVKLFAGNYAPSGWFYCWGQLLPIQQYAALFSLLGTTYGGDGRTTFALPDLRGRVPVGAGMSTDLHTNHQLGEKWGAETVTLDQTNLPVKMSVLVDPGKSSTPIHSTTDGIATPISVNQPSLGLNYIICYEGVYPQRP
jgi:microcystin-dependent protein